MAQINFIPKLLKSPPASIKDANIEAVIKNVQI